MHSLWLACLLLLAAASCGGASPPHTSARSFLLRLRQLMQRAADTCSRAGQTICNPECSVVMECVSDGHGGFQEVWLEQCGAGSRCSAERGACVTGGSACGGGSQGYIDCHAKGFFPDPYDCTLYHVCYAVNTVSEQHQCDSGYAYNPLTKDCSLPTSSAVCTDGPVPTCVSRGQSGPLPSNPSIYYFCTAGADGVLTPQLYSCPNGEIYDPNVPGCTTSAPTPTPTPTTTTTPAAPTDATPSTTTAAPSPAPGEPCWPALARVADPLDCTAYYECSEYFVWLHVGCTFGFYYNPVHGRCELGWC